MVKVKNYCSRDSSPFSRGAEKAVLSEGEWCFGKGCWSGDVRCNERSKLLPYEKTGIKQKSRTPLQHLLQKVSTKDTAVSSAYLHKPAV